MCVLCHVSFLRPEISTPRARCTLPRHVFPPANLLRTLTAPQPRGFGAARCAPPLLPCTRHFLGRASGLLQASGLPWAERAGCESARLLSLNRTNLFKSADYLTTGVRRAGLLLQPRQPSPRLVLLPPARPPQRVVRLSSSQPALAPTTHTPPGSPRAMPQAQAHPPQFVFFARCRWPRDKEGAGSGPNPRQAGHRRPAPHAPKHPPQTGEEADS